MAIDFNTFIDRLKKLPNQLEAEIPAITLAIGRGMKSQIQFRIQERGVGSDNAPLASYSNKKVPAFFYLGRSLNQTGERQVAEAGMAGQNISYKEFREFQGLQTAHTDLTFTGDMWRSIDFTQGGSARQFTVTIGPTNIDAANKLSFNSDRYGDILKPTQKEVEQNVEIFENKLVDLFNNAFS